MWNILKSAVAEVINANGVGAITGSNLQNVIKKVIDTLGETAGYRGVASITTDPGIPDGPVFYFAMEEGVYEGFGDALVSQGLSIIRNSIDSQGGIIWSTTPLILIQDEIAPDGTWVVSAKAIYQAFESIGLFDFPEFDINKAYYRGDVIRYKGRLIEMLQDVYGGRELEEGIDYKRTSFMLNTGAQSDWDQKDNTKSDYIKNKPIIPTIGKSSIASMSSEGEINFNPKILVESDTSIDIQDPDLVGAYNKTIGRAEDAIDRLNSAVMGLGPWKDGVDKQLKEISTDFNNAKGPYNSLGDRVEEVEKDTQNKISRNEIKSENTVNWESESEVVSSKAISKRIEAQVAQLMTGRVTVKGKWSSIVNDGNIVIEPGYQYVYDEGEGPFGIPLEKGDILTAIKRMENPSERGNSDNWVVAQSNFDYANLEGRVGRVESEIKDARNGNVNLATRLNKDKDEVNSIRNEINAAKGGRDSLNSRFTEGEDTVKQLKKEVDANKVESDKTKREVEIARGREASLSKRLDTIENRALKVRISSDLSEIN